MQWLLYVHHHNLRIRVYPVLMWPAAGGDFVRAEVAVGVVLAPAMHRAPAKDVMQTDEISFLSFFSLNFFNGILYGVCR